MAYPPAIKYNVAIRTYKQFDIKRPVPGSGDYTANYFGEPLKNQSLTALCEEITERLHETTAAMIRIQKQSALQAEHNNLTPEGLLNDAR